MQLFSHDNNLTEYFWESNKTTYVADRLASDTDCSKRDFI
jgi:hypothetical protein